MLSQQKLVKLVKVISFPESVVQYPKIINFQICKKETDHHNREAGPRNLWYF